MSALEPVRFRPVYQSYLWGGRKLADRYGRKDVPPSGPVAESWEVSDRDDGMSVAAEGPFAGCSLRTLMQDHREGILGQSRAGKVFPLLVKVIDARETLSIQVHPDDEAAARGIGEAKSEAWYVLDADPGAFVYCGFRPGVTREEAEASLGKATMPELLVRHPVVRGEVIYIPGGTVHAIGAGCLLLEVQQNSNTTFRLFDYDRKGPDGKTRALHLDEARKVIHWDAGHVRPENKGGCCRTPYFSIESCSVDRAPLPLVDPLGGFTMVFVEEGSIEVAGSHGSRAAGSGTTWLIPASLRDVRALPIDGAPARIVIMRGALGE